MIAEKTSAIIGKTPEFFLKIISDTTNTYNYLNNHVGLWKYLVLKTTLSLKNL